MTRIEQFEHTALFTFRKESKYSADRNVLIGAMAATIIDKYFPLTDGEIVDVHMIIAKVLETETKLTA